MSQINADRVVALLAVLFGAGSIIEAYRLWDGLGGVGLLPAAIGPVLIVLGLALMLFPPESPVARPKVHGTQSAVLIVCAACIAYVLSLPVIGYGISTVLFLLALTKFLGARTDVAIGVSIATSVATFVSFRIWLSMPLPIGPLGF